MPMIFDFQPCCIWLSKYLKFYDVLKDMIKEIARDVMSDNKILAKINVQVKDVVRELGWGQVDNNNRD